MRPPSHAACAMPKKVNATIDEVEEVKAALELQITAASEKVTSDLKAQLAELEGRLRGEVQEVKDEVGRVDGIKIEQAVCDKVADDADIHLAETDEAIRRDMATIKPAVEVEIESTRSGLEAQIEDKGVDVTNNIMNELTTLFDLVEKDMKQMRVDLEAQIKEKADASGAVMKQQREEIAQEIAETRTIAAASTAELKIEAAGELKLSVEASQQALQKESKKSKSMQQDNELRFIAIDDSIVKRAAEAADAVANAISKAEQELNAEHMEVVEKFDLNTHEVTRVWAAFNDVQNVPTRKMEWIIREASSRLRPPGPDDEETFKSWKSPVFDAAGASNLRLELRSYRKTEPPTEDEHRGNIAVLLHAPGGTNIACRLTVGPCTETFEHQFWGKTDSVSSRRLCFFEEHLSSTNTLTIGCEVLECIYEFNKKLEPPPEDALPEGVEPEPWLESSFRVQRHINNRVLEMVKTQLDFQKTRLTRRIEWRLEEASQMRTCFPRGAPMKSKEFDAAGITGMSLLFYPNGYDNSSDGYCSLFLSAPQGATLRCILQVACEKKELNHTFDKGGLLGKANFTRFEYVVDREQDVVMVSLEILEAHFDLLAKTSHPPPVNVGCRSFVKEHAALKPLGSTIKITRSADQLPPVLQEVKVLPSLWASKNRHDAGVKVKDGLKPLKDVRKGRPKSGGGGLRRSPSSPLIM